MLEKKIETYFSKAIKEKGGISYKLVPTLCAGLPDRMVLYNGDVYFVELKTDTGRLRPIQVVRHKEFAARGIHVYVLHGIEEVKEFIQCLK